MPHNFKKIFVVASLAILIIVGIASAGIHYTSKTEFCLSCHEMRVHHKELALSAHAKDADGQEIGCAQCHIPNANIARMVGAKVWMGTMDVWTHAIDGAENLDRAKMQVVARRFTDDANCRKCHQDMTRNAKNNGPISWEGSMAHANYLGENGQARSNCVGCHMNLAHLPIFDARIPSNNKFALKIKEIRHDPS